MADDLGYADIGANGCTDIPTPHIDSLAAGGARFTNGGHIAVRMGDWKLVKSPPNPTHWDECFDAPSVDGADLYNLTDDIGEKKNLATSEPAKFNELADAWNTWSAQQAEPLWPAIRHGERRTKTEHAIR
ncbi:MAG TPA: hypothetical protein VHZ24_19885 [Pirellulales bacterium]|nr:hypothetical protein [Pirellulales bacterium]